MVPVTSGCAEGMPRRDFPDSTARSHWPDTVVGPPYEPASNAFMPPVTPAVTPAVRPPIAPLFNESLRLCPARRLEPKPPTKPPTAATPAAEVTPSKLAAAGPKKKPKATERTTLPTVDLAKLLTAFATPLTAPVTDLTAPPTALATDLNAFLRYSGNPVTGLIVPAPPRRRNIRASEGVICASIRSPPRPWSAKT